MQIYRGLARAPATIKDGELYNNSKQLKAVNYCCKALHFRSLRGFWLRFWYKTSKYVTSKNIVMKI